jgi:hypothetical membrane protein
LAIPISTMNQVFGLTGVSLIPVGVLWLTLSKYRFAFAITTIIINTFLILIIALFAALSVGKAFGILVILLWVFTVALLIPKVKQFKRADSKRIRPLTPFYIVCNFS